MCVAFAMQKLLTFFSAKNNVFAIFKDKKFLHQVSKQRKVLNNWALEATDKTLKYFSLST